ncbi:hypothetical protein FLONG3_8045 [Fusarium longipes]|uniref:Arrestin-like N-terminal domain-containing protein n=1 Tax=Fusarium longipes TaxID=694270 RepID=A0A395S9L0_9HYPO|nr:hypothetical protein FLONG3_8045 [Fusarium longipes]
MPQTGVQCTSLLGIRLEGNQTSYAPGDTIIGYVHRKNHVVGANASVSISLSGRSKTKMVVSNGNSTTTYRGRFNLIPRNRQVIYEGPVHIELDNNEQAWPFAITLPKYVDPNHLQNDEQRESFLPLRATDYVLPSTYAYSTVGSTEAFVEYYLTATLVVRGRGDSAEATLPITVANVDQHPPIADFGLKEARSYHQIVTYRLVPGMEEAKLSFSQKFKQVLQTTSVPQFAFDLVVGLPTLIQLDNPNPLPIKIHIVPNQKNTSEVIKDVPHEVKLTYVCIRIIAHTEILCEGTFSPHTKDKNRDIDLGIARALYKLNQSINIPCSSKCPPVNIGKMIDLRLGYLGSGFLQTSGWGRSPFVPDFTTYNIRQSHTLKWEVRGKVAEEEFKANGAVPVKLLAPSDERGLGQLDEDQKVPVAINEAGGESEPIAGPFQVQRNESWIQPPAEDEAPPSFNQIVKEDTETRPPEKAIA